MKNLKLLTICALLGDCFLLYVLWQYFNSVTGIIIAIVYFAYTIPAILYFGKNSGFFKKSVDG